MTKIDHAKGFWQIHLSARAQDICCFSTLSQIYRPLVMLFELTNAPALFRNLIQEVTAAFTDCAAHIDNGILYADSWQDLLAHLWAFFTALDQVNPVVNYQ